MALLLNKNKSKVILTDDTGIKRLSLLHQNTFFIH